MKEKDLFAQSGPVKSLARTDKKMPIIVDCDRDEIRADQVFDKNRQVGAPKIIREVARRSKNAVVTWTSEIGWCVYAVNEMIEQRAYYFREDVDDPTLSERCMRGTEP